MTVGVVGAALTYPSLRSLMAAVPGTMFNDVKRIMYAPLPQFGGLVYVGAEYDVRPVLGGGKGVGPLFP